MFPSGRDERWVSAFPYLVSVISGSEENGEVTIITADYGPVEVKRIDGIWRIDATNILECRKAN